MGKSFIILKQNYSKNITKKNKMIENLKAKNKSRSFPVTIQSKNAKHNSVHRKLEHYSIIGIRIQYYGIDGNVNKLSTDLYFNSFREVTKDSRTSFVIF